MAEPSRELIASAKQGNQQALSQLVQSQQHYVYSIAMSVLKHPEDAADLTQEAFIRLFRTITQYHGESRFTTWLYRLVVNLCRDELRRRGRQLPISPPLIDEEEIDRLTAVADDDRWIDPVRALDSQELRVQIRQALSQLEEPYRLVLVLYYFEDMRYSDIAEILDMPLNTVKSHIRRGKERLVTILESQEQPPTRKVATQPRLNLPHDPFSSMTPIQLLSGGVAR